VYDSHGDGISDGEDINGDGIITVWRDLDNHDGTDPATTLMDQLPETPDGVEKVLEATAALPGESTNGPIVGAVGGVNLVGGKVPVGTPMAGVLAPRTQEQIGSCAAFATSGAIALLRYQAEKAANPQLDINSLWPAPLYVYQYNATFDGSSCSGTNIETNLSRFLNNGAPAESELPYPSGMDAVGTNSKWCTAPTTDAAASSKSRESFRIGGFFSLNGSGTGWRTQVKKQLDMGRPIVFGVSLPIGFMEWRATTAEGANMPTDVTVPFKGSGQCDTSTHCGGHAMIITGYDDSRSAYRVLNSWGGDWGDNGYLWWDYASLEALNPYGSAPYPVPAGTAALGTVSGANTTLTVAAGTSAALAQVPFNGGTSWRIISRIQWNAPVTVTKIYCQVGNSAVNLGLSQGMLDGDLQALVPGSTAMGFDPMSIVGQTATIKVTATAADGTTVTQSLPPITVPMPTM
jgi:hypothetical protein